MCVKVAISGLLEKYKPSEEELAYIHPDRLAELLYSIQHAPGLCVREIGKSLAGRPIYAVDVGVGKQHVVCVAGAHADEPIGTVTVLELIRLLASDLGKKIINYWSFHFIPQLDPDGAILNWHWMKRSFTFKNLSFFSYRSNDPAKDIEHGIPLSNKQVPFPEVQAFIDYTNSISKIDYYVTLHTTHVGGGATFLLCSKKKSTESALVKMLGEKCLQQRLPLWDLDLHEHHGIKRLAPGFHTPPLVQDLQDAFSGQNDILQKIRMTTYQYATDVLGVQAAVIAELPSILIPEMNNTEETCISLKDFKLEYIRRSKKILKNMEQEWGALACFSCTRSNEKWIQYYSMLFKIESKKIIVSELNLHRFSDQRAREAEVHELALDHDESEYKIALMGFRRLLGVNGHTANQLRLQYRKQFENAFQLYENRRSYSIVSRLTQVQIQMEIILAGTHLLTKTEYPSNFELMS